MPTIDGLVALVGGVKNFFAANGVTANVDLGWKARFRQSNQGPGGANRVVFIPGRVDDPSATEPKVIEAGAIGKPRMVGDNPRALAWWHRAVTVSVWGVDTSQPGDEGAQYSATVALFEQTIQAMHRAVYQTPDGVAHNVGLADIVLDGARWVLPPGEMNFGRELVAYFQLGAPFFDVTLDIATPSPAIDRGTLT